MKQTDILHNLDGSKAVFSRTKDGRVMIAEGTCVYTANAALRALFWSIPERFITKARERSA